MALNVSQPFTTNEMQCGYEQCFATANQLSFHCQAFVTLQH